MDGTSVMDYTMDHDESQPHNPPCQNISRPRQGSLPSSQLQYSSREGHHYDPVYNVDSWYGHGGSHFAASSHNSQWGNFPRHDIAWHGLGDAQSTYQGMANSAYSGYYTGYIPAAGPSTSYGARHNMFPSGYSAYLNPTSNTNTAEPNAGRNTASQMPLAGGSYSHNSQLHTGPSGNVYSRGPFPNSTPFGGRQQHNSNGSHVSRPPRTPRDFRTSPTASTSRSFDVAPNNQESPANGISPARRRRSNYDSDEEDSYWLGIGGRETYGRRYAPGYGSYYGLGEVNHRRRFFQTVRATKKPAVPEAIIDALEKVKVEDLEDKSCMICYNDLGAENPDGLTEQPLRLPKCKHVFGDACIKKWFEDNDTCPYCRNKLSPDPPTRKDTLARLTFQEQQQLLLLQQQQAAIYARAERNPPTQSPSSEALSYESPLNSTSQSRIQLQTSSTQSSSPDNTPNSSRMSPRESQARRSSRIRHAPSRPNSMGSARFTLASSNSQQRTNYPFLPTYPRTSSDRAPYWTPNPQMSTAANTSPEEASPAGDSNTTSGGLLPISSQSPTDIHNPAAYNGEYARAGFPPPGHASSHYRRIHGDPPGVSPPNPALMAHLLARDDAIFNMTRNQPAYNNGALTSGEV